MREEKEIRNLIPSNLLESLYFKNINKMKDIKSSKMYSRFKNYLKINYQIFQSRDDFEKYFYQMQKRINDYFIHILYNNNNKYDPNLDVSLVKDESLDIIKNEQMIQQKQNELDILKEENTFLNEYLQKIKNEGLNLP